MIAAALAADLPVRAVGERVGEVVLELAEERVARAHVRDGHGDVAIGRIEGARDQAVAAARLADAVLGDDVRVAATDSYVSLLKGDAKFGVVAVTADRMDVGIKLKTLPVEGRVEESGKWNSMVTHRVRVSDGAQLDDELVGWLRQAYEKA